MQVTGLEFYTAKELVQELMNRQTFLGLVIHSEEELRENDWHGEKVFKIHLNRNLDTEQASRLLNVLADRMQFDS
jgi:hypothetical protein